jgi:predicted Rossmann fold flavoprotein
VSHSLTHYDVVILGAGASGLMCAFTAAGRGLSVLVLEKANKVGKKILMSGGGRCNFTNYSIDADNFISDNPHFCKSALNRFSQWDFIAMVDRHGIEYEQRTHNQLFCEHSAKDILNMLLLECDQAGVAVKTHCEIRSIECLDIKGHSTKHQKVDTRARYKVGAVQDHTLRSFECRSLVVATGALSIPTLGGSGFGYEIAKQFSLPVTPRQAGLVPFMFSDSVKELCTRLSGLALEVSVSCNDQSFTENLLFTHRGMSGPVVLQISNYWKPGVPIYIDFFPGLDVTQWLLESKASLGKLLLKTVLSNKLAKSLVRELQTLWWFDFRDLPMAQLSDRLLKEVARKLSRWEIKPSATEGYRTAEVTLGGVDTDCVSSKTMEAKQQAGLYFIGEVLDVTGHLGGFNFQWAWSSGYCAGIAIESE